MTENSALLIVDLQNDFCPGGALQIINGDRIIEPTNEMVRSFSALGLPVLASRDWHLPNTSHFYDFGGQWPVHCVRETEGAAFHPALCLPQDAVIISKGTDLASDGYSAFAGMTADGKELERFLRDREVTKLCICGLATDYCVLSTTRDALGRGFQVMVLSDAVAGVDSTPGDSERALAEMDRAGAQLITSHALKNLLLKGAPANVQAGQAVKNS
jgi:nicotinamidase/pyrazinamidase